MSDLIRSSALSGYCNLVLELGGNPQSFLKRFNWSCEMIEQGDAQISYRSLIDLMEATASSLRSKDFGLRLGSQQGLNVLGPLAIIMLNSPTVGDALKSMIRQIDYFSPAIVARIVSSPRLNHVIFSTEAAVSGAPHRRQTMELAIRLAVRDLQILTNGRFSPRTVLFRHSALAPSSTYSSHFETKVKFEQLTNGVEFATKDLDLPLKANNPTLRQIVAEYVEQANPSHKLDFESKVIFLIRHMLPDANLGLRIIANHLCVHERTLQRHLALHGSSFDRLLDSCRRERAETLLTESHLPISQITAQLGYSQQSSLNKACRRWFDATPLEIRTRDAGSA